MERDNQKVTGNREAEQKALIADLALQLRTAVARVEIANTEGNPILSAWLPEVQYLLREVDRRIGPAQENQDVGQNLSKEDVLRKSGLQQFTAIGYDEDSGQICSHNVWGKDATNAFASAAIINSRLSYVVAIPGWLSEGTDVDFPGEGVVSGETILEQPEVFGSPYQETKGRPRSGSSLGM